MPISKLSLLAIPFLVAACTETEQKVVVPQIDPNGDNLGEDGWLSAQRFCPSSLVPRKDMARYLERMKRGRDFMPPPASGVFSDVPDPDDAAWAEVLYNDRITRGTTATTFAPEDPTPREQMAAFIVRLTHGSDFMRGGPSRFTDVDNPDFVGYIEQLADDGITKGCSSTEFCPHEMVPRDQMAAFLMRALHPGTADPAGTGRFEDVPSSNVLAGRVEQAVSEGIMEPCGELRYDQETEIGSPGPNYPVPTISNFIGWIGTTPNYGLYANATSKRYWNEGHKSYCGGDYNVTTVLDIGEVTSEGVYVNSITFYTVGVPRIVHQSYVWAGTTHHIDKFENYHFGYDDFGIPYVTFMIDRWFPNGQGDNGDALQIQHTMIPNGVEEQWATEIWDDPTSPYKAGLRSSMIDNPDGGFCSVILRGAMAIYP